MKKTLRAGISLASEVSYGVCISLLFGIMAAGQLLGFAGLYHPAAAAAVGLALAALAAFLYFRENPLPTGEDDDASDWLQGLLAGAALLLVIVLVAVPLLNWPASPIGRALTWDAGAYHFPKAVELYRSGSVWDLSIPYGDYPFGYESLLAFGLALTGDESLFGAVHLLTMLFFWLATWKLARRYTGLPAGALLLASATLLLVGILPIDGRILVGEGMPAVGGRAWFLSGYALTIGKNDFLLGAALLAAILHSPVGPKNDTDGGQRQGVYAPLALGMAGMLALATKPNALGVLGPVGLYTLWAAWTKKTTRADVIQLALAALLALPGLLWIVRNLAVLGVIFTPAAASLSADSIFNNFGNPYLYANNPPFFMLVAVLVITAAALVAVRFLPSISPSMAVMQAVLFVTFIITPATAFHRLRDIPSHIAWRFGVALLVYTFVLVLAAAAPLLRCQPKTTLARRAAAVVVTLLAIVMLWQGSWITAREPENAWILHDQFAQPVGVDGYYSAYDYARQNIEHSVIHVENGLAYYLYGPGYTNTPTKLQYPLEMADQVPQPVPDYFVIFRPDWQALDRAGEFPPSLDTPDWQDQWQLDYNDGEGRVYRKIYH